MNAQPLRGHAHVYGKNVDTDVILPGKYLHLHEPREMAPHAMEGIDEGFAARVRPGDFIVAEANFGCGSSRENAPLAIKGAGVGAVVASSFARIFYRNAINIGLPIFESPEAAAGIAAGDEIEIDPVAGNIRNITKAESYRAAPFPPFMRQLIEDGGLRGYIERRLAEKSPAP